MTSKGANTQLQIGHGRRTSSDKSSLMETNINPIQQQSWAALVFPAQLRPEVHVETRLRVAHYRDPVLNDGAGAFEGLWRHTV